MPLGGDDWVGSLEEILSNQSLMDLLSLGHILKIQTGVLARLIQKIMSNFSSINLGIATSLSRMSVYFRQKIKYLSFLWLSSQFYFKKPITIMNDSPLDKVLQGEPKKRVKIYVNVY